MIDLIALQSVLQSHFPTSYVEVGVYGKVQTVFVQTQLGSVVRVREYALEFIQQGYEVVDKIKSDLTPKDS